MSRKRKKYVRFRSGLIVLVISFLLSLTLGYWLKQRIENIPLAETLEGLVSDRKDFSIRLDGLKFQFRNGWLPALAISSESLTAADQRCKDRNLVARKVFVPIKLLPLLTGKVEASRVYAKSLVSTFPKTCLGEVSAESKTAPQEARKGEGANREQSLTRNKSVPRKVFRVYEDVLRKTPIEKIEIDELQLMVVDGEDTGVQVHGSLSYKKKNDHVEFSIFPKKLWVKGVALPVNKGEVMVTLSEERVSLDIDTRVREGRIQAQASFINSEAVDTSLNFEVSKVPISILTNLFLKNIQLRYLWFNCKAALKGEFDDFFRTPFPLNSCALDGPYGSVRVVSESMTLERPQSVTVRVEDLQLDEVLKRKRDVYLSGVFSSFGTFQGEFHYDSSSNWKMKGLLTDADVVFSRNSLRELQKIRKLPFQMVFAKGKYLLDFTSAELDQGDFDGQVRMRIDQDLQNGDMEFSLNAIGLNPKIYRLMLKAQKEVFSLFAKVQIRKGLFASWSGVAQSPRLSSDELELERVKVESLKMSGGDPSFVITSIGGLLKAKKGGVKDWLRPTTLESVWPEGDMALKSLSVGFVREQDEAQKKWVWQRGKLDFKNGWSAQAEGQILKGRDIDGWFQWNIPKESSLKWGFRGQWGKTQWSPQLPWMKDWLQGHADFVSENPAIEFLIEGEGSAQRSSKGLRIQSQRTWVYND